MNAPTTSAPELWAAIPGFEGHYEVSTLGRLKSLPRVVPRSYRGPLRVQGKLMAPATDSYGYLQVRLSINGVGRLHLVHRIVAAVFLEPVPGKPEINHLDLNKTNNAVANLEFVTHHENMRHLMLARRAMTTRAA